MDWHPCVVSPCSAVEPPTAFPPCGHWCTVGVSCWDPPVGPPKHRQHGIGGNATTHACECLCVLRVTCFRLIDRNRYWIVPMSVPQKTKRAYDVILAKRHISRRVSVASVRNGLRETNRKRPQTSQKLIEGRTRDSLMRAGQP